MNIRRAKHAALLARPVDYKCTKKFDASKADVVKFRHIKHPVVPLNNKRLDMLAIHVNYKSTAKWKEEIPPSTCVSRAVLEAILTPRLDHMSRPTVRVLEAIKKERSYLGKSFIDSMNDRINMSLDTIYYHNVKSLMNIASAKKKESKSVEQMPGKWSEVGNRERMEVLAKAKRFFPPKPLRKRKRKDLQALMPRIEKLSCPVSRRIYIRPSAMSVVFRLKISKSAMKYKATDRILNLTQLPAWKLIKPWTPVAIKRSALFYVLTDRTKELATPRPRTLAADNDLKENAYQINPYALKCKPTPRIIQLAKPIER